MFQSLLRDTLCWAGPPPISDRLSTRWPPHPCPVTVVRIHTHAHIWYIHAVELCDISGELTCSLQYLMDCGCNSSRLWLEFRNIFDHAVKIMISWRHTKNFISELWLLSVWLVHGYVSLIKIHAVIIINDDDDYPDGVRYQSPETALNNCADRWFQFNNGRYLFLAHRLLLQSYHSIILIVSG